MEELDDDDHEENGDRATIKIPVLRWNMIRFTGETDRHAPKR